MSSLMRCDNLQGKDKDLLFFLTEKQKFCILEYNAEKGEFRSALQTFLFLL